MASTVSHVLIHILIEAGAKAGTTNAVERMLLCSTTLNPVFSSQIDKLSIVISNGCSECFCIFSISDPSLKSQIPTNRWPAFSFPSSEAWDSLKAE